MCLYHLRYLTHLNKSYLSLQIEDKTSILPSHPSKVEIRPSAPIATPESSGGSGDSEKSVLSFATSSEPVPKPVLGPDSTEDVIPASSNRLSPKFPEQSKPESTDPSKPELTNRLKPELSDQSKQESTDQSTDQSKQELLNRLNPESTNWFNPESANRLKPELSDPSKQETSTTKSHHNHKTDVDTVDFSGIRTKPEPQNRLKPDLKNRLKPSDSENDFPTKFRVEAVIEPLPKDLEDSSPGKKLT